VRVLRVFTACPIPDSEFNRELVACQTRKPSRMEINTKTVKAILLDIGKRALEQALERVSGISLISMFPRRQREQSAPSPSLRTP